MKKRSWKKVFLYIILFLVGVLIAFFLVAPGQVEESNNRVLHHAPYTVSTKAQALHKQLFVADLHADSLLWDRNLLQRGLRGQVDIPRLIEGNVAIQAFTVVTKTPRKLNIEKNDDSTDNILLLAICERWPIATWRSLTARATYQAEKLNYVAEHSEGKFTLIKSTTDLDTYLKNRAQNPAITAGFLGIEGAQALDGRLENLTTLYQAGFRMMAPTHFFDNEIAGSAHGLTRSGLTPLGKQLIPMMESLHMIVDVAHASPQTIDDVLAIATKPILVSHTGVKGTCNNNRNLSDEQIKAIAQKGGVIGIGYWDTAVCGQDAQAIAKAIRYTANIAGVDHVALGSDFDGAVTVPFDTSGVAQVTEALLAEGFTDAEVGKIMGGNVLNLLKQLLPPQ